MSSNQGPGRELLIEKLPRKFWRPVTVDAFFAITCVGILAISIYVSQPDEELYNTIGNAIPLLLFSLLCIQTFEGMHKLRRKKL